MNIVEKNIKRNIDHYNNKYSVVDINIIVNKVRNLEAFLKDAINTDTSWHGLYQGNFASRLKNKRVLELGFGDGLNALIMAALGADVIANDISSESERLINEAISNLEIHNIHILIGNLADLIFDGKPFDFIVGKAFLHHLTHDLEMTYLKKISTMLKPNGEVRFFEPATNSQLLDNIRCIIPFPGRPSILNRNKFSDWKERDPHPERDNSSDHFIQIGKLFFHGVEIIPIGSIERFCRLLPQGKINRSFRRWAHRIEKKLPMWFRYKMARSQLIVYTMPQSQI